MRKAEEDLAKAGLSQDARLLLQVHDELVYEIKKDKVEQAMKIIENSMRHAIPSEFLENLDPVPLEVSASFGRTWGDLK